MLGAQRLRRFADGVYDRDFCTATVHMFKAAYSVTMNIFENFYFLF